MTQDWARLGAHITADMVRQKLKAEDIAAMTEVNVRTVQRIMRGESRTRSMGNVYAITNALGWDPDRTQRVLNGEHVDERPPLRQFAPDEPYERRRMARREMYDKIAATRTLLNEYRMSERMREKLLADLDAFEAEFDWTIDHEHVESEREEQG